MQAADYRLLRGEKRVGWGQVKTRQDKTRQYLVPSPPGAGGRPLPWPARHCLVLPAEGAALRQTALATGGSAENCGA